MKKDTYFKMLSKTINDPKEKDSISRELSDCIEDFTEKYRDEGFSLEEAEDRAVAQMGDPKETGILFNKVYYPRFEWKVPVFILLYAVLAMVLKCSLFGFRTGLWAFFEQPFPILGIPFILFGFLFSISEKLDDLPFFYPWPQDKEIRFWATPGIGTWGNGATFTGLGVGITAGSLASLITLWGVSSVLLMVQRLLITEIHNHKEQRYLWRTAKAVKDFNHISKVDFGDEMVKVQIKPGETAKAGDMVMVVGMSGNRLLVENCSSFGMELPEDILDEKSRTKVNGRKTGLAAVITIGVAACLIGWIVTLPEMFFEKVNLVFGENEAAGNDELADHSVEAENVVETGNTIQLSIDNWEDYFEYVQEEHFQYNDAGGIEEVYINHYIRLKDEYVDLYTEDENNLVYFMYEKDYSYKEYEFLDKETGKYQFTGKESAHDSVIFGPVQGTYQKISGRWDCEDNCVWICMESNGHREGDRLFMEVVDEMNVFKVTGSLLAK